MTKLFKRLISAFKKLGARVVFASFSRIIVHTDKEVLLLLSLSFLLFCFCFCCYNLSLFVDRLSFSPLLSILLISPLPSSPLLSFFLLSSSYPLFLSFFLTSFFLLLPPLFFFLFLNCRIFLQLRNISNFCYQQ